MAPSSILEDTVSFEKRLSEASRILTKYPDRIPVVCEVAATSTLPEIGKKKFLVPCTMLVGEFKYMIHKQISQMNSIGSDETIYLFVNNTSPKTGSLMSEVYEQGKSADGYLYISYSAENTLGR